MTPRQLIEQQLAAIDAKIDDLEKQRAVLSEQLENLERAEETTKAVRYGVQIGERREITSQLLKSGEISLSNPKWRVGDWLKLQSVKERGDEVVVVVSRGYHYDGHPGIPLEVWKSLPLVGD